MAGQGLDTPFTGIQTVHLAQPMPDLPMLAKRSRV